MQKRTSLSTVQNLLKEYQLAPRKRWGQNFLVDENIVKNISKQADINKEDYVIEIGPGLGALTVELALAAKGVLCIDIDEGLKEALDEVSQCFSEVKIIFADILKLDIEKEIERVFELKQVPGYKVCANIPYNITTPIVFQLLENCPHMKSATLMMQKEVAHRILAQPGNKDYGLLTLMVTYYCKAEFLFNVSRNCFYPRPEVDSSVIKLTPYENKPVKIADQKLFKSFIRSAFQKRRKTILNIASSFFGFSKAEAVALLEKAQVVPSIRPENLKLDDFARIINLIPPQEEL